MSDVQPVQAVEELPRAAVKGRRSVGKKLRAGVVTPLRNQSQGHAPHGSDAGAVSQSAEWATQDHRHAEEEEGRAGLLEADIAPTTRRDHDGGDIDPSRRSGVADDDGAAASSFPALEGGS
eukprot:COSAG01_NODE_42720_length_437_cov_0.902367_1_plen_120_part_01